MFKKPNKSRKNVRRRKTDSDEETETTNEASAIEMARLKRELTKKSAGVSAATLAKVFFNKIIIRIIFKISTP